MLKKRTKIREWEGLGVGRSQPTFILSFLSGLVFEDIVLFIINRVATVAISSVMATNNQINLAFSIFGIL